jgi:hypothetical protein
MVYLKTLLVGLVLINQVCSQELKFDCYDDLVFLYTEIESIPSYKILDKEDKLSFKKSFDNILNDVDSNLVSTYECFYNMNKVLEPLNDNHSEIYGNAISYDIKRIKEPFYLDSISSLKEFNVFPKTHIDLDSLQEKLRLQPIQSVQGIYSIKDVIEIIIYKDEIERDYKGIVTRSKIPLWKRGEQILELVEKDGYFQILTGGFNDKKLLFYRDKISNGRFLFTKWSKTKNYDIHYDIKKNSQKYEFSDLNSETQYLRLSSFSCSNDILTKSSDFSYSIKNKVNKDHLIVDLRNNSGGCEKNSKKYLKLLKRYSKNHKGKIFVLVNFLTRSNSEQFLLKLRKINGVVVLGDDTNGSLSFGWNTSNSKTSPSKRFNIHLADMDFSQNLKYQNVGIKPEHYLNVNSDWIKQTLSIINDYK